MKMEEIFTTTHGIESAQRKNQYMKRNRQISQIIRQRRRLLLGDLILAVSSCTESSREMVAAVADLLDSGQVRVQDNGRFLRARVC
jgi:hypothetical protein